MLKVIFIIIAATNLLGIAAVCSFKNAETRAETETPTADSAAKTPDDKPNLGKPRTPVIVELFTSEGCSSCPPADRNLIYLNDKQPFADAEVITLSLHVDYWNQLGWTDKFSSAQFSERQGFYSEVFNLNGVYTPQIVVDGRKEFVGGNLEAAKTAVAEAVKSTKTAVAEAVKSTKADVELKVADNKLQVKIENLPEHAASNVLLAIAEDDLSTAVGSGENGGRTLNHASVVRELKTIGRVAPADKNFTTETAFEFKSDWKKQNLKIVVLVQEAGKTSHIIGANQIKL